MNISFIPAGADFLKTLAVWLQDNSAETATDLSRYRILLPTRRAVRTLQQLLTPTDRRAVLLPHMHAIGDLDEDVLTLHQTDLEMPPVISATARLGLLTELILEQEPMPWPRAMALANALAKLLDESILREVPLARLETLVPAEMAEHWQISLTWLQMIIRRWPEMLAERGEIDAKTAQQNLLNHYAALWQKHPPDGPVIAAGSTGSLPATRRLLHSIARLPRGMVILPALDTQLPDDVWDALPDAHPQHHLKNLLDKFELSRRDVTALCEHECDHGVLWQRVLLPAAFTEKWRTHYRLIQANETDSRYLKNLRCFTAREGEEEAQAIALIMQRAAADKKTAALITPDRALARRTAAKLSGFGITVNDTAGQALDQSPVGRWLRLVLRCWHGDCDAVTLLGIMKHPLSCFGMARSDCRRAARELELKFFRAEIPAQDLSSVLRQHDAPELCALLSQLPSARAALPLAQWVEHLQKLGDALTAEPDAKPLLWQGDAGAALRQLLDDLAANTDYFRPLALEEFTELLEAQMSQQTLHQPHAHPDLHILGPLEARLHHYDTVILGGLNEGSWPQATSADPWLSRPMRQQIELALPDEMLALSAHDFYQLAAQKTVYLTRAAFAEGAPTLPSRWWQRLNAYLEACQMEKDFLEEKTLHHAIRTMNDAENISPADQPAPNPPVEMRPRRFSPSAIETLMRNPYEYYAKYILRLRVLPELGAEAAEKEQGELFHSVFAKFTKIYPAQIPNDIAAQLDKLAEQTLAQHYLADALRDFWWQSWLIARDHFIAWHSAAIAAGRRVVQSEYDLEYAFQTRAGDVQLFARADRIDVDAAGNYIIVDYKRKKSNLTAAAVQKLNKPQLVIEGWLLTQTGIPGEPKRMVSAAEYWPLLEDEIIAIGEKEFQDALARLPDALSELLGDYLSQKPYAVKIASNLFEDQKEYLKLARVTEWQGRVA